MVPEVTIVLSTYNRPEALVSAIAGVRLQSVQSWRLLIIGDACTEETARAVERFDDPRIHYINLKERCGEQSGPNSIGLELADTEFVAFLNHDDIWLPDHLATGLKKLRETRADFFCGRAAFAVESDVEPDRLFFTECSPYPRKLRECFYHKSFFFEPVSAWILRREAAKEIGQWTASTQLYRSPLEDWVLRAWRKGLKLVETEQITVLKPRLLDASEPGALAYDATPAGISKLIETLDPDGKGLRRLVASDLVRAKGAGTNRGFGFSESRATPVDRLRARLLNPLFAWAYWFTSWDAYDLICQKMGVERGHVLRWALNKRTGESLKPRPDLGPLLEDAKAQLALHDRDQARECF